MQQQQQFPLRSGAPPPGLQHPNNNNNIKGSIFPAYQMANVNTPKQPSRLPPGFSPMQLLGTHQLAGGPLPHPHNIPRTMPHNLPVALNNFAVSTTI